MTEVATTPAEPIPQALCHLIQLNPSYKVLICLGERCRCAVSPGAVSDHLRRKHQVPTDLRKQVDRYIEKFPFPYDYSTIPLPVDGSAPQPIIPINDGFKCEECMFKTRDRSNIRKHANKEHNKKRIADEDLFSSVRLQSWFGQKRERYWVVDESKQDEQEHQTRRAITRDVGEEFDDLDHNNSNPDSNESGQEEVDDQIVQDIEKWKADAQERRLTLLKNVPVVEMDSWLQYTKWNEVLSQSKHNLVKTFHFTRVPEPEEPELERLLRAWSRILERCLSTLEATDHKDALKWWASPKNEAASQRPFELPQNAKSIEKYSGFFESFICYMMRTAPTENWTDETGQSIYF
jgi:hypothetical protein